MRLAFFGTPEFSCPALEALIGAGHEVAAVYTQPPRKAARGQRLRLSPVHSAAQAHGLDVRTPKSLKDASVQVGFADLKCDAAVIVAYGLILPAPILDAPTRGCFNIHASLLPRWRGAAPIQRAILAGDTQTGITIMFMDEGLDTGPELLKRSVPIGPATTAGDIHDSLAALGAEMIVEALAGVADNQLKPVPQASEGMTYAAKLERGEGRLDWTASASELDRKIRAFTPWPGTWFEHDGETIKILAAHPGTQVGIQAGPGTALDSVLTIACGDGALVLDRLQRPGKSAMESDAFLRGHPIERGTVLA